MTRSLVAAAIACVLLPLAGRADDWVRFKSGPFEVFSSAGEKQGRIVLNDLEQLRHVLGNLTGKPEMKSVWPVRVLVVKPGRVPVHPIPKLARDAYIASVAEVTPEMRARLVEIFIDANAGRLPAEFENGLVKLLSSMEADGPRVTVGTPPAKPDREWARMHMLTLDPRFSGKLRVLLYNLQQAVEPDPAYRNAFAMGPAEIERELDAYMKRRDLEPGPLSGRALSPRTQFRVLDVEPQTIELALLDLKVANGSRAVASEYAKYPGALETAVPLFERARAEKDTTRARALFQQAAKLNPLWAEPHWLEAQIEDKPLRKIALLKTATQLAPRSSEYWVALARAQESARLFNDAVKSWAAGERAAATSTERERIRAARIAGEQQRLEQARLEKEEERRKAQAELDALRQKGLESIRAAEVRANAGNAPRNPDEKLEMYREDMGVERLSGGLFRVVCLSAGAVLHIDADGGAASKLHVPDPAKVAITGGGVKAFSCGAQKPARKVRVEYVVKSNAKLGTAGEVTSIEFE